MLSSSEKVAGQGVSGAYRELVSLLHRDAKDQLIVTENLPVEADVTHFHTIDFPYYLSTFQKKRSGRKIGYVHFLPDTLEGSLKIPFFLKGIVKRYVFSFYNRMEHLVVVNPMFIEDLVAAGIPREKVTYIPNFVNKEKWHPLPAEQVAQLRKEMDLAEDQFVVIGAGQVQKRKGIDDFIRLAEELPEITFIWAGGFSFGGMTDGYERYKKIMDNPPKNLIFPGIVSPERMRELYAMADLFLLPSYNELFPMTILGAEINKVFGDKALFENASFQIPLGAKVALTGGNGIGKTTLIQMILNHEEGISISPKAKIGYFAQNGYKYNSNQNVMEFMQKDCDYNISEIRSVLASMGFKQNDIGKSLSVLSGGEIIKLLLAKMLMGRYNILIMDEPSNFLDIPSLEALEILMKEYTGTIVFITHDKRLLENVADVVYEIRDKKINLKH
ncbi:ATP-binding cassette domain-containing protein [uncultured Streptococcus sp.]|uniref:ATP-binding cassette domain-containing protein n=1 Tax=uncultured Streptococcus sp. TaxID=83427 RepID=UPI0028057F43|nr:ATP-binding cassette domain-containing protein [uncultured Streptococcus sp.]